MSRNKCWWREKVQLVRTITQCRRYKLFLVLRISHAFNMNSMRQTALVISDVIHSMRAKCCVLRFAIFHIEAKVKVQDHNTGMPACEHITCKKLC